MSLTTAKRIVNNNLTWYDKLSFNNYYLLELHLSLLGINNFYSKKFNLSNASFKYLGKYIPIKKLIIELHTQYITINESKIFYEQIHSFGGSKHSCKIVVTGKLENLNITSGPNNIELIFYFNDHKYFIKCLKSYLYYYILYKNTKK
jgi:hypothetical protein